MNHSIMKQQKYLLSIDYQSVLLTLKIYKNIENTSFRGSLIFNLTFNHENCLMVPNRTETNTTSLNKQYLPD